jgi:hypothetical protein
MITLNQVYKHLKANDIKIKAVHPSSDWQVEDDEIILDNNYYLQIGENYIILYFHNDEETFFQEVKAFKSLNQTFTNLLKSL